MDEEQKTGSYQQHDERFVAVLKELERVKQEYAVMELERYARRGQRASRLFRFSGALIIILSVSIPFLTTLEGLWKTVVLPIVALMIAGLSGLNAFFQWENNWRGFIAAKLTLEHMLWTWELKITEAKHETDPQKGIEIAIHATEQLLNNAQVAIKAEMEDYFKRVQAPQINKGP